MLEEESIKAATSQLEISWNGNDLNAGKRLIAEKINDLIVHDFQKLILILYRLDINEEKLKNWLKGNPHSDAGIIIADLIIERELQKIKSREKFKQQRNEIDDEEKW